MLGLLWMHLRVARLGQHVRVAGVQGRGDSLCPSLRLLPRETQICPFEIRTRQRARRQVQTVCLQELKLVCPVLQRLSAARACSS